MWTTLAHIVLKYRLTLIIILGVMTAFMGYHARKVEYSFELAKIVPDSDPDMVTFTAFKELFGEDGNALALGLLDSTLYTPENFTRFKYLSDELSKIEGVNEVISLPVLKILEKNTEAKRFEFKELFTDIPEDQHTLDSLLNYARNQKFYSDQILNTENGATFILITIEREVLNTSLRDQVIQDIKHAGEAFEENTGIDLHYVGLPYIRTEINGRVKVELQIFLVLSLVVTALILLFFFRSWDAVLFPMIIIMVMVIWSMGTLGLFGYKITMLTGLLPPIIVVIGIPNSVYLLNKFHNEIEKHGNKIRALSHMIRKIGIVTLITNSTTAVGFLVLTFTDIVILKEFGLVAGINILATFIVSIILIPAVFSYLPAPHGKQLRHLRFRFIDYILTVIDLTVHRHKYTVFGTTVVVVAISVFGLMKLNALSYMVDDVPEESTVKQDLYFFEDNFSGIMPLEIVIDTQKKKGALNLRNLKKINELEERISESEYISKPISMSAFFKAARQAFYNNKPDFYQLPDNRDQNFIFRYLSNEETNASLLDFFVDSTRQVMRSSFKVADVGSHKLDSLIANVVQANIDSVLKDTDIKATVTGTTLLFVKGNTFLIKNLQMSLVLAFVIIAFIMGFLFRNVKMILISLIPNLIPLMITAGLMGYFNIPIRPSTALIFCVVFGIAVDDSIHFLAKYRQELFANNFFVPLAISKSIRETGASMMYTSIILFAGFVIFSASDFVGTKSLGILTSTTLLIAMFTNLILLPSLLMAFDDGKRNKDAHPPIEHYDEFYQEDEDEEIDLELIDLMGSDNGQETINSNIDKV